jgi:predicted DsbA family dithiol-disulfide isomerase
VEETFFVDVWSDVVCPFCYLGTRQLALALEQFDHRDEVVVRHRAFELDPRASSSYDLSLDELLASKYGMPLERARSLNERLESDAADLGMSWHMKVARPANTFDAHRLIALAASQKKSGPMSERLFRAYFSDGELLSDADTLVALGTEVGVTDAEGLFSDDRFASDVREDERQAQELGITGVPSMLVDGKFMVMGAQGTAQILDVLTRAWAQREELLL